MVKIEVNGFGQVCSFAGRALVANDRRSLDGAQDVVAAPR